MVALSSPIEPGFDLLKTESGTEIELPPGSGVLVPLEGNPALFPSVLSGRGADTIVERKQGIDPFDPPGGVGTVDIELVALSLKSTVSFDGTPLGILGMVDLYVIVKKALPIDFPNLPQLCTTVSSSTSSMTIKHTTDNGGTFTSNLTVDACLIFVTAGGNVNNPADVVDFRPLSSILPDPADRTLRATDVPWSHTPPAAPWPTPPSDFPAGGFYPIPPEDMVTAAAIPHNNRNSWIFWEIALLMKHGVRLEATDVTLNVSKNGNQVNLTLTTSSEPNAAEFLILRGDKLDNGGTAMDIACSFASKGVSSSYTCTDDVVGDSYRVLEKEYDGRVILYDEVTTH
ncbi:MAG: hypothetical protein HC877_11045 [Thioploca sp.]|nr:hypothetical protein [Thioploca sp.]